MFYYDISLEIYEEEDGIRWSVVQTFSEDDPDDIEVLGHGIVDQLSDATDAAVETLKMHFNQEV